MFVLVSEAFAFVHGNIKLSILMQGQLVSSQFGYMIFTIAGCRPGEGNTIKDLYSAVTDTAIHIGGNYSEESIRGMPSLAFLCEK